MEKRYCVACGEVFTPRSSSQKFCEECREHNRTALYYQKAVAINRRHAGDYQNRKTEICNCKVCGKKFISYKGNTFCSLACQQTSIAQHARCPICNTLLIDKGITSGRGCCSDECRQEFRKRNAIKANKTAVCEQCGNEFIRGSKTQRFCCKECYLAFRQDNKPKIEEKKQKELQKRIRVCLICKRPFEAKSWKQEDACCSEICKQKLLKANPLPSNEERCFPPKKQCSLCVECKTSQKDCERFTSGFTYYPQGTIVRKIDGKEMVISCPKYKRFKEKKHA